MTGETDIFGRALKDYFDGQEQAKITLHVSGEESYDLPVSIFFRKADQFPDDLIALQECSGKVLDIGAGTGIHSLWLTQKGLDVTANDISGNACKIMRGRGLRKIAHCDMLSAITLDKYDTYLILGRSIGATGSVDGLDRFLKLSAEKISDSGVIILNSKDDSDCCPKIRDISFEYNGCRSQNVPWLDMEGSKNPLVLRPAL